MQAGEQSPGGPNHGRAGQKSVLLALPTCTSQTHVGIVNLLVKSCSLLADQQRCRGSTAKRCLSTAKHSRLLLRVVCLPLRLDRPQGSTQCIVLGALLWDQQVAAVPPRTLPVWAARRAAARRRRRGAAGLHPLNGGCALQNITLGAHSACTLSGRFSEDALQVDGHPVSSAPFRG